MNTAHKIYLTQLTQLLVTIIQSVQLILLILNIIPYNTINIIITLITIVLALVIAGYSFDIEQEYMAILDDLKHDGRGRNEEQ